MPTVNKTYSLTINPDQFLEACSCNELIELQLLLDSPHILRRMNGQSQEPDVRDTDFKERMELIFSNKYTNEAMIIMKNMAKESTIQLADILPMMKYFHALEKLRLKNLVNSPQEINLIGE